MNVTESSNPIYLPCVWLNPTTGKAEFGTYDYTAFMEKFQKQIQQQIEEAKVNPPEIGKQELSDAEIQELATKYDPRDMTQDEYDAFIRYLQEKGVLSQLETSDLGMSRITIVPGYFEPAYIWTSSSGAGSSVHSLSDVGGNALRFAQIMSNWKVPGSSVQIRQGAYSKVLGILNQMDSARGSAAGDQTSSASGDDLSRSWLGFRPGKNGSSSTTSSWMMDLSSVQLAIDRIKSESIQTV